MVAERPPLFVGTPQGKNTVFLRNYKTEIFFLCTKKIISLSLLHSEKENQKFLVAIKIFKRERVPFGISVFQKIILVHKTNAAATWRELSVNKNG